MLKGKIRGDKSPDSGRCELAERKERPGGEDWANSVCDGRASNRSLFAVKGGGHEGPNGDWGKLCQQIHTQVVAKGQKAPKRLWCLLLYAYTKDG